MIKQKKIQLLIFVLAAMSITAGLLYVFTLPKTPVWNGFIPGEIVDSADLQELNAIPATISGKKQGRYEFKSEIPSAPNVIELDPETNELNLVSIEEPVMNPPKFVQFASDLGKPELELYQLVSDPEDVVYAYPSRGLAFFINKPSDIVYRRWYFSPISIDRFLEFSKDQLTLEKPEGERLEAPF